MEALSRTSIPVTLCKWTYFPELEEWQLIVASPWYDSKGLMYTSRAVPSALERTGIYKQIPIRRLRVTSPKDPLVKALKQQVKEQNQGFIHILKPLRPHNGDPYSLIFAPIAGSGGALPARRFASLGDLELFLGQNLHLKPSSILDAIHELKRDGASFVYPVSLAIRQAKKMGLA